MLNLRTSESRDNIERPDIKLNDQSLEAVGKFCYLGDTIGAKRVTVDITLAKQ